jgi:hypothetical protein
MFGTLLAVLLSENVVCAFNNFFQWISVILEPCELAERINGPRCEGRKQPFEIARQFGEWCPGAAYKKYENSKPYKERAGK